MNLVLKTFLRDRTGATVIIFALALIPILGLFGGAIDYGRAYTARTQVQRALDAAVLTAAVERNLTNKERIAMAEQSFAANMAASQANASATPVINITADKVTGTVNTDIGSTFTGLFGIKKWPVAADSEASLSTKVAAEVVLVLDYSGSMKSNGKYQTMRDAAIELVNNLSDKGQNNKVKFGLVPFSKHVYTTLPSDYVINETPGGTWTNCTMDRKWSYNTEESTPLSSVDASKWGMACSSSSSRRSRWGGHDDDDDDSSSCNPYSECSDYPALDLVVRPLTNDHNGTIAQLNAMTPLGWTHIALGLSFGWHLISPDAPWTEGQAYNSDDLIKAIVLLTDGAQTAKAWGQSDSSSSSNGEANLEALCQGVKDRNVLMVTVAFDLKDTDTKTRLQNCATSSAFFFDASSNAELAAAFDTISKQLVKATYLSH